MLVLLYVAGGIHFGILGMNAFLPALLRYEENLAKTDPIIRQVFYVHNAYILLMLAFIGSLCLFLPDALMTGGRLATVLNGFFALFWGVRIIVQLVYYDQQVKERFYAVHLLFTGAISFLTFVFFWLFLQQIPGMI